MLFWHKSIVNHGYAGVFALADSRVLLRNCTVAGNGFLANDGNAAGVFLGSANLTLENCILAFNKNGLLHAGTPPQLTVRNSDFYNPDGQEIIWNDDPGRPDLTTSGNLTANPFFVDLTDGNYELAAISPAIDSGRGAFATATDILGRERFDDQGMPNVGTGYPSYVDMGAYERQQETPAPDLAVTAVSDPSPAAVAGGQAFTVQYTVTNIGAIDLVGPWRDVVYLSDDPYLGNDQVLAVFDHVDTLARGASYTKTVTTAASGSGGPKYILVRANADRAGGEAVETNNVGMASRVVAIDVPVLQLGAAQTATIAAGQWHYYRFMAAPGGTVLFSLDGDSGSLALYVRRQLPPTASRFEAAGLVASRADQEARLLHPLDDTYYVGVFATSGSGTSTQYTLKAATTELTLLTAAPDSVANAGTATIKITGDGFDPLAHVHLVAPDGTGVAGSVQFQDSTTVFATFDLAGAQAAAGIYDIVVSNPDSVSATLAGAVNVISGGKPRFQATLTLPGLTRPGRTIDVRIDYANTGTTDLAVPHLRLTAGAADVAWKLPWEQSWMEGPTFSLMGLSSNGPPTTLRPGQRESLVVKLRLSSRSEPFLVTLSSVGTAATDGSNRVIDWVTFEDQVRPPEIDDSDWNQALANLQDEFGDTWGGYVESLRQEVERRYAAGSREYNVRKLWSDTIDQALGQPTRIVAGTVKDADTGLPVGGVQVEAWNPLTANYASATTANDGSFLWDGLGAAQLGIEAAGYLVVAPKTIELPADSDLTGVEVLVTEAGHVMGRVTSGISGKPIGGAEVVAWGSAGNLADLATTDQSGTYYFDALPTDAYVITSSAASYAPLTKLRVGVTLRRTSYVDFALGPEASISGSVVGAADGVFVEGARVAAYGAVTGAVATAYTDSQGTYRLSELPTDEYLVTVSAPTYVSATANRVRVSAGSSYAGLNFPLDVGAAIEGRVYAPDGSPVGTATVICKSEEVLAREVRTNMSGEFMLTGLATGHYEVWAYSNGLAQAAAMQVSVVQGQPATWADVHLVAAGSLGGKAVSSLSGDPIVQATARLEAGALNYFSDPSGNDGSFSIADVAPGVYRLVISAPGFTDKIIDTLIIAAHQTVTPETRLDPLARITGTVRDTATENALARAKILAWENGELISSVVTDAKGAYEILVPEGPCKLMIEGTGAIGTATSDVTVLPGEHAVVDLSVTTIGELGGYVYRANGATPMQGVQVHLVQNSHIVTTAYTDSTGHYAFYFTGSGEFDVVAVGLDASFAPYRKAVVTAGEIITGMNFTAGTTTISGRLLSVQSGRPVPDATLLLGFVGLTDELLLVGSVTTDKSGDFAYSAGVPGQYRLISIDDGYALTTQDVTVTDGGLTGLQVFLEEALSVAGAVMDAGSGTGIEGALVYLVNNNTKGVRNATFESAGQWYFDRVAAGSYDLVIQAEGFRRVVVPGVLITTDAVISTVELHGGDASIVGVIQDQLGSPVEGAEIVASDREGRPAGRAVTNSDGAYSLGTLSGGTYDLVARANGFSQAELKEVSLSDGQAITARTLIVAGLAVPDSTIQKLMDVTPMPPGAETFDAKRVSREQFARKYPSPYSDDVVCIKIWEAARLENKVAEEILSGDPGVSYGSEWENVNGVREDLIKRIAKAVDELNKMSLDKISISSLAENQVLGLLPEGFSQLIDAICYRSEVLGRQGLQYRLKEDFWCLRELFHELWVKKYKIIKTALERRDGLIAELKAKKCCPEPASRKVSAVTSSGQLCTCDGGRLGNSPTPLAVTTRQASLLLSLAPPSRCSDEEPVPDDDDDDDGPIGPTPPIDPEDKFGPRGYDGPRTAVGSEKRYVRADTAFDYRIEVWNDPQAVVPAQIVTMEDALDLNVFDPSTFEFTALGFLKWDADVNGGQAIETRLDLRPDMNLVVDVTASFDPATGKILWRLEGLDPMTGELPEDPLAGILPPLNPDTAFEMAWFEYRVRPKNGLPSGTRIANQAFGEFDDMGDRYSHPAPPGGPWINTIDAGVPSSYVVELPRVSPTTDFVVNWAGQDDSGGSGIGTYDVFVSDDGGDWEAEGPPAVAITIDGDPESLSSAGSAAFADGLGASYLGGSWDVVRAGSPSLDGQSIVGQLAETPAGEVQHTRDFVWGSVSTGDESRFADELKASRKAAAQAADRFAAVIELDDLDLESALTVIADDIAREWSL